MQQGERYKQIRNVTLIGFVVNLLLTLAKLFAGIVGKSSAMIADGVHSLSDFATDIVVIVFMRVSDKKVMRIINMVMVNSEPLLF